MNRFISLALLLLVLAAPALAQEESPVTADDINRVAGQLYCPQCENISLEACGTAACVAWKQEIGEKLGDGWTDQEIIDYFVAQYGQRVLSQPNDPVIGFLLVAVPLMVLAAGAVGVVWFLRRGPREAPQAAPTPSKTPETLPEDDRVYRERLERELDEMR